MEDPHRAAPRRLEDGARPPSTRCRPRCAASPAWTYWLARALQADRAAPREAPQALYQRIADQNNFYGQLALEELGQQVSIPPPGAAAHRRPKWRRWPANPGLRRALKFFSLRLRPEGTREWNWELRKFSERELLAAAEFARRNDILDRMVHTSERTRTEFDYTQRFPAPHNDILQPHHEQAGPGQGLGVWPDPPGIALHHRRALRRRRLRPDAGDAGHRASTWRARSAWPTSCKDKLNDLRTNLVLGVELHEHGAGQRRRLAAAGHAPPTTPARAARAAGAPR